MPTKRILLIEDEDDIREVARMTLEITRDWDVVTAGSGREGIARAQADAPDAILLDVMMPDMDGPTTYVELKSRPATRPIPVIFLTAKVQSADRTRFETLGAAGFIAKPFDPITLADEIAAILGWEE